MASMNMTRAFNAKMITKMYKHGIEEGSYDDNNDWVQGRKFRTKIYGVIKSGNKFSQFEEGEALHAEDGGQRFSSFRTLYITDKYTVDLNDKIEFQGQYFNVLQRSDEVIYRFRAYLLERSEEWTP